MFNFSRALRVLITSSDSKRLKILTFPMHKDPIINDLIEIDLSDGMVIVPINGLLLDDLRVKDFFIL